MIIGDLVFGPAACEKALYQMEGVSFVNGTQHTDYSVWNYFLLPKTIDRPPERSWKTLDIAVSLEK